MMRMQEHQRVIEVDEFKPRPFHTTAEEREALAAEQAKKLHDNWDGYESREAWIAADRLKHLGVPAPARQKFDWLTHIAQHKLQMAALEANDTEVVSLTDTNKQGERTVGR